MNLCRMTNSAELEPIEFNFNSCKRCFDYLQYVFYDFNSSKFDFNLKHEFKSMLEPIVYNKWQECCKEAELCCKNQILYKAKENDYCKPIWDGWSCHSATRVGQISKVKCPEYHVQETCNTILDHVYFECSSNSTWYRNYHGYEWADYSKCISPNFDLKKNFIYLNITCNFISLVFLVFGLIIFSSYRKLKVNRIKIHKNFFLSLVLHSIAQILWEYEFMLESLHSPETYVESNNVLCIISSLVLHYTRATNYFWMFNESLYLFMLLNKVFKEQTNLLLYYTIGWFIPLIVCLIFSLFSYKYSNHSCWLSIEASAYKILVYPNITILVLNLIFLIIIIRLLFKSLRKMPNEVLQYKKTFKATLFLVPLFGIHYFLSPITLCNSNLFGYVYNIVNRLIENLQGLFVALIFCFMNNEVKKLVKSSLKMKFNRFYNREEFGTELVNLETETKQ